MNNKSIKKILDKSILPKVNKPGRYIGNEINVIYKDPNLVDIRFLLSFPELYEIGMSSQAMVMLYHILNRLENVWAERAFAPWNDMEEKMRQNDIPLYSLESFTPALDFDIIGFTLQYELTYSNILNMLDLAGIPVRAEERGEKYPLIIAGGPCSCNPEPVADFFDAILIGDGEEAAKEICDVVQVAKSKNISKIKLLQNLAKIRGVYVPSLYKVSYSGNNQFENILPENENITNTILSRILPELKNEYYPEKPVVPLIEVTHDRLAVEVMRGCTEGCRFCNAGMIYRPIRERNANDIVDYTLKAIANSGYEELSLLSLSISDYSQLDNLLNLQRQVLKGKHVNVSFPSMRLDSFSEEIAEFAKEIRKSGFTFAPEAGSQRLRNVINKNITEDDLLKAVKIALESGWKLLKFYFMIGLPTETKEDIKAIGRLIEQVVQLSKKYRRVKFKVSISPFSPKSHTPFQWEKQDTKEEFFNKIDILKNMLYRFKQVSLNWRDPAVSEIECILGRGDRRMAQVVYRAWKMGAKFDGWSEFFDYDIWEKSFKDVGLDNISLIKEISESHPLAWDHIDKGITKKFLLKERKNAYNEININDCKDDSCISCGIQRKKTFGEFTDCYSKQKHAEVIKPNDKLKKSNLLQKINQANNTINYDQTLSLRMQYEKVNLARYVSHLDLVRIFDRACRQAEIPLVFSQGFNQRPKISFCQPLALGQSSESEYLDLEMYDTDIMNIKEKLNSILPNGIKILKIKKLSQKANSLTSVINLADYIVDMPGLETDSEQINNFLAQESIIIDRERKGKSTQLDLRPFIKMMKSEKRKLYIRTKTIDGRTARIDDIIYQLLKDTKPEESNYSIHRKNQFIQNDTSLNTPLEVC